MADLIKDMIKANKRNAIKVSKQSRDVRGLLSMANTYTKADENKKRISFNKYSSQKADIEKEIATKVFNMQGKSRKDLLCAAVICATSVNGEAQAILIKNIALRVGKINYKDFIYMDELILSSHDSEIIQKVNNFLFKNLEGFKEAHNMYYYALYNW